MFVQAVRVNSEKLVTVRQFVQNCDDGRTVQGNPMLAASRLP